VTLDLSVTLDQCVTLVVGSATSLISEGIAGFMATRTVDTQFYPARRMQRRIG
jgi:hypothetical protein